MPSVSQKQHNLMAMVANNPAKSKQLGIPQSVGEEFMQADKGRKFREESRAESQSINKPKTDHGKSALFKKGGNVKESKAMEKREMAFMKKHHAPKSMIKHEESEMKGMKKGGSAHHEAHAHHMKMAHHHLKEAMKAGGHVKKYAAGGDVTGSGPSKEKHGMTMEKMGGVKAGGIKKFGEHPVQEKGHTRGKNLGDAGKTVPIQTGAVGMKRGGHAKHHGKR